MARRFFSCVVAVCLPFLSLPGLQAAQPEPLPIGAPIRSFTLGNARGAKWSMTEVKDQKLVVVAFLGTECPLVQQYASRLQQIADKHSRRGVAVVGVFSNQQDSLAEIGQFAKTLKIDFPLLKDPANLVADHFHAARTPEVFVLDAERKIRYHGRIDDQFTYGIQRPGPKAAFLVDAIDALLAGKPVPVAETEPVGCHIGRVMQPKPTSDVTYSKQISRILNHHCVECHRAGEIGPFALTSYEETVGWAEMIREVVKDERMPPWHADPKHGKFANDARLSDADKQLLYRWVDNGAPEGNPKDLPPAPKFADGWRIGKPDVVVPMSDQPFTIPAKGDVEYQYFVVDPGFKEDKWIQAAECRPGNRKVVHHIILCVHPHNETKQTKEAPSEFITASAAGSRPMVLPEGFAKFIPAGAKLVFQIHYTSIGTTQEDRSSVGFIFADAPKVRRQVGTRLAANHVFRIPPKEEHQEVDAAYRFTSDSVLLSMFPHLHLRGKSFRYTAIYPSGQQEILLDVPRYDSNWQNSYILAEPKAMPKGTRIECKAVYDNSENNPANPAPSAEVRWGEQAYDEMMIGYLDAAPAKDGAAGGMSRAALFTEALQESAPTLDDELKTMARDALKSDANLRRLAPKLRAIVPQLDRVCWTTVEGDRFRVRRCVQSADFEKLVGGSGKAARAYGMAVASYAGKPETVVHQQLAKQNSGDLKMMSRAFGASLHVPVKIDGVPGTINFWSGETDAFPDEAVTILTEVAKLMAGPK